MKMGAAEQPLEQTILEAAKELLAAGGPKALTMQRLAERTGLSRATLYRQVGSKAQLLARLAAAEGREPAASTRERILHAARRVFARRGFVAATIDEIADEAGVGVATVYRLFGSKEGLLRAFAEEVVPRAAVRERAARPTADVRQDLIAIVRPMLAFFYEHRDLVRLALLGHDAERRYLQNLRQDADTTLDYLAAYFHRQMEAGRLKPAGLPRDLALGLLGLIFAFAVIGPVHYGTFLGDLDAATEMLVGLFLDSLETKGDLP